MTSGDVLLDIRGLGKDFGGVEVIRDLNLHVGRGERHAIIGPNGAGKTTLFNLITGRYTPTRGTILFKGRRISGIGPHRINRLGISRSFQITNLFPSLSVGENIRLAVQAHHCQTVSRLFTPGRTEAAEEETARVLKGVNLIDRRATTTENLAYGEQRQLEIAIALAGQPRLLLLDEPTAGMSPAETQALIAMVQALPRQVTLIIIEHDMDVVFSLADTITVLHQGEVLAEGEPAKIERDQRVLEVYLGEEAGSK